jgi:hypothetical protein
MKCKTWFRCEWLSLMFAFVAMLAVSMMGHTLLHPAVGPHAADADLIPQAHTVAVYLAGVGVGALVKWEACKHIGIRPKP